jgi:hypothetical protein
MLEARVVEDKAVLMDEDKDEGIKQAMVVVMVMVVVVEEAMKQHAMVVEELM